LRSLQLWYLPSGVVEIYRGQVVDLVLADRQGDAVIVRGCDRGYRDSDVLLFQPK
jgi:hypothetical protein